MLSLIFIASCQVEEAKPSKNQYVNVYSELIGEKDELLYRKFEKKYNIKVKSHKIHDSLFFKEVANKKYLSEVDLILFNSLESILEAKKKKFLLKIPSKKLIESYDPIYRSKNAYWFALSKSPIVIIYNKTQSNKNSIKNYHELTLSKWKGLIGLQDKNDPTLNSFYATLRILLKDKADDFIQKLENQCSLPKQGTDFTQIKRVENGQVSFALVKLSSLTKYHSENFKNKAAQNVLPIFPNQRSKGAYFTITGAGIYRYAENVTNAVKLLEFLASESAQTHFAGGRFEYPIIGSDNLPFQVEKYGKYRARFYKKVYKNKKRP
jgi:iron(III) transport system substrate-binding protein